MNTLKTVGEAKQMDDNWNMNGRYRVFSIDKKTWVDIEFTGERVLVSSNTKKITLAPQEPMDTYLRRINDKMNLMAKELSEMKERLQ